MSLLLSTGRCTAVLGKQVYRVCSDQGVLLCCVGPAGAEVVSLLLSISCWAAAVQGKQVYEVRSGQGQAGWIDLSGVEVAAPGCLHKQGQLQHQVLVPTMGLRLELLWPGENAWFAGSVTDFDPAEVSCAPGS